MRGRLLILLLVVLVAAAGVRLSAKGNITAILNSKHDFRAGSGSAIRSVSERDACIFCHTPHSMGSGNGTLLWNHKVSLRDFSTYNSSTLQSMVTPIQSQDTSRLCLSCHDGTIALGDTINNGLIEFVQGKGYHIPNEGNLGNAAGFSDDHPFGFVPATRGEVRLPAPGDPVHLDGNGKLQCTSCHDPHQENLDSVEGKFLVKRNDQSALCVSCHQPAGWSTSAHRLPPDPSEDLRYGSQQGAHTGYRGVSQNGCESCHRPHSPQVAQRLVKFPEEQTCYQCHDGSVTKLNIQADENKTYRHPVQITPSAHDESESPNSALYPMPENSPGAPRHAECVDCHNPHFANNRPGQAPQVSGALMGVRGQSAANTFLPQSANEYEICFKCHGDSANKPQLLDTGSAGTGYGRNPQRQFNQGNPNRFNQRMEFQYSFSFHPVTRPLNASAGPGGDVPSLRPAPVSNGGSPLPGRLLSPVAYVYCTDCHNSDTGRNLGSGVGAEGPHGSNIAHILERQNMLEPPPATPGVASAGVPFSVSSYALCDKCHDVQNSILRDVSFKKHSEHVQQAGAACSTCHDPHGSPSPMLINFDRSIVGPASNGVLQYTRTGLGHGTCTLTCHGQEHKALAY
ncbi:MAG TPA: cytochrome c3 family protein [Terriglobales bacterium]|nr:cytochrome c3 family protein [Terriglobales bacterium]